VGPDGVSPPPAPGEVAPPSGDPGVAPWAALDGGLLPPDEGAVTPPDPWYVRHWWIWPAAAAVIGAAVAVPLLVERREVVDIRVHF